jgi:hypothetical protein
MQSGPDDNSGEIICVSSFVPVGRTSLTILVCFYSSVCSSIWAPQPRAYNIEMAVKSTNPETPRNEAISEGEEADEEFLVGQKALPLSKIRE